MDNKNTVIDAKIGNLNELTKVLSVKEQAQEQLLVVMKALGIGKIVRKTMFFRPPTEGNYYSNSDMRGGKLQ